TKNILYTVANSDAPTLYTAKMTTVEKLLIVLGLIFAALFITYYVRRYLRMRKWKMGERV
ncbi:MAG: hypothetical protein K6F30_11405, partial [Lachnospiraceae bacterium]|nr:hypothetical protein [Lachnospiraceae bacterium]